MLSKLFFLFLFALVCIHYFLYRYPSGERVYNTPEKTAEISG